MVAVPWYLLRGDGQSPRPVRAAEILLGVLAAVALGVFVFVLSQVAIFIA